VILFVILTGITVLAGLLQLLAYRRMYVYVQKELRREQGSYCPKAAVILPCKGLDPGFENNIKKLFEQQYYRSHDKQVPNFEILFAVAAKEDPAFPVLSQIIEQYPQIQAKLVVAGTNPQRAQKVNNQLSALKHISSDVEVLVFVDSDMVARPDFIQRLVAPLAEDRVGIATGYRFYIPFKGDWPSLLRTLWNRVSAWELVSKKLAFAWGGAMAITYVNFKKAHVAEAWDKAADDDLSMTTAVKKLGLDVRFVPQCLVASDGDAGLGEIIEWTNRQLILTKVYYPPLWRKAIMRALILAFWLVAVLVCAYQAIVQDDYLSKLAGCMGLSLLLIEIIFLVQAQKLWRQVLFADGTKDAQQEKIAQAYKQSFMKSIWMLPLAHCLLPWITLNSLLTNRIRWRGVTYELKSPTETIIV